MYIPPINILDNKDEMLDFMHRFSFATIITSKNNLPIATHLPFIVTFESEKMVLTSHFAKANPQWQDIESTQVLVIFSEPHAYISPKNYDHVLNVPTWNYISIHAYGTGKILTEPSQRLKVLETTIDFYEPSFQEAWKGFSDDYKSNMINGIVAFQVNIDEIQAKKKISQNRSETEKQKIIDTLSQSKFTSEKLIAEYMQKEMDTKNKA